MFYFWWILVLFGASILISLKFVRADRIVRVAPDTGGAFWIVAIIVSIVVAIYLTSKGESSSEDDHED